jgi:hypothetical protein
VAKAKQVSKRPFDFKLTFTNGTLLRKFLEPAANSVKKIRIVISNEPDFTGFRTECLDQALTLALRGMIECDVDTCLEDPTKVHGLDFCVASDAIMEALMSSTLKETDLCLTRYMDQPDKITFESTNNENDVRTVYNCNLVDSSQIVSLDGISIELQFHVNVLMSTLKEISSNARKCGASNLCFDLWQAMDPNDPNIMHSKMCIGFSGTNTSGMHDFFISTRKEASETETKWVPLNNSVDLEFLESLKMELRSSNQYDNKKLRLFLNNMECTWVLVHLSTENASTSPLVLNCVLGGAKTKHTVIVAPKEREV